MIATGSKKDHRPVDVPVFIHSSFRTSSTWLWERFRSNPKAYAYCEAFHGLLATLRPEDVGSHRFDTWASKHPRTDPYFIEFPLLSQEGGARHFERRFSFAAFIPEGGITGRIDERQHAYISSLIENAAQQDRVPVITFTRSLGRAFALRRDFSGHHIFSYRNLSQQWISYLNQFESGNNQFLVECAEVIKLNQHDRFISELARNHLADGVGAESAMWGFRTISDAYLAFMGLHLYLYMFAAHVCDQRIDINRLVDDVAYRSETENAVGAASGICIDLSTARNEQSFSETELANRTDRADYLFGLVSEGAKCLSEELGTHESVFLDFGSRLLTEALGHRRQYLSFGHGAYEPLRAAREERDAAVKAHDEVVRELREAIESRDTAIRESEAATRCKDNALRELDDAMAQLRKVETSPYWKLTEPLRALSGHLLNRRP